VHPLADTVAAPLTLTALALLTVHRRTAVAAAGAGVLLVAAVVLRPQLLPVALAVVVAVLAVAWRGAGWGRARWLAVGVGVGAAAAGLLDTLTWGTPFAPLWRTFTFNIVDDGASRYGRSPWSTYLTAVWHVDGPVLTVLLVGGLLLACRPRRGDPFAIGIVVGGVVVFVAVLSLIGHKELRFLVPMLPVAGALAGVGLARGLRALLSAGRARASALRAGVAIAGATAAVTTTGLLVVPGITMSDLGYAQWPDSVWTARDATPRLLSAAGALPGTCGVALVKSWLSWSGGYSALHRDVPLGYTTRPYDLRTWQRWANVVVARTSVKLPAGYRRLAVRGDFVLAQRPGGCAVPPAGVPQRTI
ncbi:MAG TPA: hypothetical protein VE781_13555, partial [Kineosporiaceae bacterium]|nr:hypothetical protein [Kineosporiaceae bacterium]